jgi:hypothetical protein
MRCFHGFQQFLTGFYPESALFSLSLQHNAVMKMLFSRYTTVEQLPAATRDHSWQVNAGFWERAGSDSYQNYCWRSSQ